MMIVAAATKAQSAWSDWIEFQDLRFQVQRMYLVSTMVGGPFIRTNDPEYQAYVYADAVVRAQTGMLRKTVSSTTPHLRSGHAQRPEHSSSPTQM
jgi:hypothetical protein